LKKNAHLCPANFKKKLIKEVEIKIQPKGINDEAL